MKEKYEILDNKDFLNVIYYIYDAMNEFEIDKLKNEQYYGLSFLIDIIRNVSLDEKIKILEKLIIDWELNERLNPNYFIDFDETDPDYDPRYPQYEFDLIDYILRIVHNDEIELEDLEDEDE